MFECFEQPKQQPTTTTRTHIFLPLFHFCYNNTTGVSTSELLRCSNDVDDVDINITHSESTLSDDYWTDWILWNDNEWWKLTGTKREKKSTKCTFESQKSKQLRCVVGQFQFMARLICLFVCVCCSIVCSKI